MLDKPYDVPATLVILVRTMKHRRQQAALQAQPDSGASTFRLPTQDTRSLRQKAVEALRVSILQGHLRPGDRLRESDLAAQMGISRGPVREALRELERDGLVIAEPYRETVVADISMDDVREILVPVRRVLETFAVREAMAHLGHTDVSTLEQLVAEMRAAGAEGDLHRVVEADVTFHRTIMQLAGNRYAMQIWDTLSLRIRTHFYRNDAHYANLSLVADEHAPLLDALRSRDAERALAAMEQHLHSALTLSGVQEDAGTPTT